ncbi:hypothetical protein V2J09_009272, partial [Rumex salicifolius]
SVLEWIASTIGKTIKLDKKTLQTNRGRFARVCVEVDLTKPLKSTVILVSTMGGCIYFAINAAALGIYMPNAYSLEARRHQSRPKKGM